MDNTFYVGLSRQQTLQRELDVVSNNVANLNTAGFKVESLMLKSDPLTPPKAAKQGPINFVYDEGVARDFTQGALSATGGDFDFAVEGKGFFQVQTPDGVQYTRDGRFTLGPDGTLATADGDQVLGDGGSPITIDPSKGQLLVAADGTISQAGGQVGKLGVVTFDDMGALAKAGGNLLKNTTNQSANPATTAKIRQGMLEQSNVNGVSEISRMIEVTRAYDQITTLMNDVADTSRRSVERLGSVSPS